VPARWGRSLLLCSTTRERGACAAGKVLNDLQSPLAERRTNGTVRYLDAPFEGEELLE